MHDCPACEKPATLILSAALRQSPSAAMTTGALLPSSSPTRLRGACARIAQPTSGEPVNVSRLTSGCSTRALPTTAPDPVTTWRYPAGSPHSSKSSQARARALYGVWPAGFSTTAQPAAIAGASLCATRLSGKLNGLMAPTTPIGTRSVNATLPSAPGAASSGITSPTSAPGLQRGEGEGPGRPVGLDPRGLDRLGRLAGDDLGELLLPLAQQRRRAVEDRRPLPRRQRALGHGRPGCGHGGRHLIRAADRHPAEQGAVVGGTHLGGGRPEEGLPEQGNGRHGFTGQHHSGHAASLPQCGRARYQRGGRPASSWQIPA